MCFLSPSSCRWYEWSVWQWSATFLVLFPLLNHGEARIASFDRVRRLLKPGAAQTANDLHSRLWRNQVRVIGSPFTLHVGWIKRGETALRMYSHLPRHFHSEMWNWSGGRRRGWWVAAFDVCIITRGPLWRTIPHVAGQRSVRQPLKCSWVWQIFARLFCLHKCGHWVWPETETRKRNISSPNISWEEPGNNQDRRSRKGDSTLVKVACFFLQFPKSKGCSSWRGSSWKIYGNTAWSRRMQASFVQVRTYHWSPELHKQQMICRTRFWRNQVRVVGSYSACGMNQARRDSTAHVQPPASPLVFALVFLDVELLWWSLSKLVNGGFWWLHKRSRPSLAYHPTCKRTFLEGVGKHLDYIGLGKSSSDFPLIRLSLWTLIELTRNKPERWTYICPTSAEQNLAFLG